MWMLKFKDAVFGIALEPGSVGIKLMALKFLETFVLLFTSDISGPEKLATRGVRQAVNVSWLVGGHPHPVLDPAVLMSDANKTIGILLNLLQSVSSLPGCLTITVVNWMEAGHFTLVCDKTGLAAIARKRPQHYDAIFSELLYFDPNFQTAKGCHIASIQYSLRTAFLGFLRERLIRSLRAMNVGDAADQVIRQVDKMNKNGDRSTRDARVKNDQPSTQSPASGELSRKRPVPLDNEQMANGHETISKWIRSGPDCHSTLPAQINDSGQDLNSVNGVSPNVPVLDSELTAVEQMIAVIGTLLAEGERGAESLEILISKIHPDLLADIVITNMKHLPNTPPPLARLGNSPVTRQLSSQVSQSQVMAASVPLSGSAQASFPLPTAPVTATATTSLPSDTSNFSNQPADSKRDPQRDPRRVVITPGGATVSIADDSGATKLEFDEPVSSIKPVSNPVATADDNIPSDPAVKIKNDDMISEASPVSGPDQVTPKTEVLERPGDIHQTTEADTSLDPSLSSTDLRDEDPSTVKLLDDTEAVGTDSSSILEFDQFSVDVQVESTLEDTCLELPQLPPYVELSKEQESKVKYMPVSHIIDSYKNLHGTYCQQFWMPLLARLVAQIDDDNEFIMMLQKLILEDHWRKYPGNGYFIIASDALPFLYQKNTRAAYPIEYIPNAKIPCVAPHSKNVILLACDAFGVLPPVAGTEDGIKEPQATFSACFGAAFIMMHPTKYAAMLAEKMQKHGATGWLVNSGWSGGSYGVGNRIKLPCTRKIIDAIHFGSLLNVNYTKTEVFGLEIPTALEGVPSEILDPVNTWSDKKAYQDALLKLASLFKKNFDGYTTYKIGGDQKLTEEIVSAGLIF